MTQFRYARVSRRSLLTAMAAGSAAALVGCTGDAEVLAPASPTPGPAGGAVATDDSLPGTARLSVTFTYEAASTGAGEGGRRGGMVRNPYIAVWVEDAAAELVATVALWHLQGGEDRWLTDLTAWYDASGGVETVSSATRTPGTYTVAWDCTDDSGRRVPPGEYRLYIESAREHGPYQIVDHALALGGTGQEWALQPSGEIVAASAAYTV